MLTIHGNQINGIHDDRLSDALGPSYTWTTTFFNYIHGMINGGNNRFASMNSMIQSYLNTVRGNFIYGTLNLAPANLYNRRMTAYPIRMTGDRDSDVRLAVSTYHLSPANYTWHHAENIWYSSKSMYCNMYLVDSNYHKAHHCGGVNEYKWIYEVGYRPE